MCKPISYQKSTRQSCDEMWILLKNFPIEEDQTEQKFLIINLEQVFDQNHFKCEFYKKSSLSKLIEVRKLKELCHLPDWLVSFNYC